jgi:hypothetical protein
VRDEEPPVDQPDVRLNTGEAVVEGIKERTVVFVVVVSVRPGEGNRHALVGSVLGSVLGGVRGYRRDECSSREGGSHEPEGSDPRQR